MTPFKIHELTNDVESLATLNKYNANYSSYFGGELNREAVSKDFSLLKGYTDAYQKRLSKSKPAVGDCLSLPDGQFVYFCCIHPTKAQTCKMGSFCLTTVGTLSYSGGLDSGISLSEIELTNDRFVLPVWFYHNGHLCAGCAIYAHIECRVWKTKEGADLSGIPQVEELRRRKLKKQSETITKIDGNGRQYQEHLPEIIIYKKGVSPTLLKEIEQVTGLAFTDTYHYYPAYWCQPMKLEQINKLKSLCQFEVREERDFLTHEPLLILQTNI
jgi:hypothetical protein